MDWQFFFMVPKTCPERTSLLVSDSNVYLVQDGWYIQSPKYCIILSDSILMLDSALCGVRCQSTESMSDGPPLFLFLFSFSLATRVASLLLCFIPVYVPW